MVLNSRGSVPENHDDKMSEMDNLIAQHANIPKYDGRFGYDSDEKVLDGIENIVAEFVKIMYEGKGNTAKMAIAALAFIKGSLERRQKYEGK